LQENQAAFDLAALARLLRQYLFKMLHVFPTLRDLRGGHHDSRTGAEGCTRVGGIGFFGWDLSIDDVFTAAA
jgi:hypothetical protein